MSSIYRNKKVDAVRGVVAGVHRYHSLAAVVTQRTPAVESELGVLLKQNLESEPLWHRR